MNEMSLIDVVRGSSAVSAGASGRARVWLFKKKATMSNSYGGRMAEIRFWTDYQTFFFKEQR